MSKFACAYVRVSTIEQARHDISIPDQLNQIRQYAMRNGYTLVQELTESGRRATSDSRPVLKQMLELASQKPPAFQFIIIHSMSRLFRDAMHWEYYRRRLEKNGVEILSVIQDFGSGDGAEVTRRFMALIDEMNSRENAKHVRRTMMENARQGYLNGSKPPVGYKSVAVDVRGNKEEKKLVIDPMRADFIRLILKMYIEGDGVSGPVGNRTLARYLNERGYKTSGGGRITVKFLSDTLNNETYIGKAWYDCIDSKFAAPSRARSNEAGETAHCEVADGAARAVEYKHLKEDFKNARRLMHEAKGIEPKGNPLIYFDHPIKG